MRKELVFLFLLSLLICSCDENPQIKAAYDLIGRVTPGYEKQFELQLIPDAPGENRDVYEITGKEGHVILKGNNTISIATAFNQYLKYTCNAHVSWLGNQLDLPEILPAPKKEIRNTINGKYRVYLNYCTLSYSAAWWNWERWEKELDYMAMNSINMPLSVIGVEAVWYRTLLKFNFTDEEARSFLVAPSHFAWQWMQNIQTYGGMLPKSWIDKHIVLGKQIMSRQVEMGMQPIQQGFSGYVPRELKDKFPEAKIRLQPSWCGFEGAAQLDPTDPLFKRFGRVFLAEEKALFGAHGVYAADPFHESAPPVDTKEYLNEVGRNIYSLFKSVDPNAVWAIQAWSLRKPVIEVVPKDEILVLDLNGERSSKEGCFWGYPTIAGNLHNFGGRINLHGDLALLAKNQYVAAKRKSENIVGSGLFMESIQQNPVYYDLAFEMPLHTEQINLKQWIYHYADRRYGVPSDLAYKAWDLLLEGPYQPGTNGVEKSSIIAARPALEVKKSGPNDGFLIPYDPMLLIQAEGLLLQDKERLQKSSGYRFDVMDIQRQIMSNLGQAIHKRVAQAFYDRNFEAFKVHSNCFLTLLKDVDRLLRTRKEFNFDSYLKTARSWGETETEKDQYEQNATTLFTIWGADGDPIIFDNAWHEWSGIIDGFYLQRWQRFYAMLEDCLINNISYSETGLPLVHGRETFRANAFYNDLADWEVAYTKKVNKIRTPETQGDEMAVVSELYSKYKDIAQKYDLNTGN